MAFLFLFLALSLLTGATKGALVVKRKHKKGPGRRLLVDGIRSGRNLVPTPNLRGEFQSSRRIKDAKKEKPKRVAFSI